MTPGRQRATDYVLWIAAFAWPLQVFTQSPVIGLDVSSLVAIMLAALLLPGAIADRKLHVPFEAWAPAATIAAIVAFTGWRAPSAQAADCIGALFLFVAVIQAGPSRDATRKYLFASVASIALVTLISLVSPMARLVPTALSLRSDAAFTFAFDLAGAVHILLIGVALCVYVSSDSRYRPGERAFASATLVLLATLLIGQGIHWWTDTHSAPIVPYPAFRRLFWAASALALWLFARVLAKIEVERQRTHDALARAWWGVALMTVAVAACAPLPPRPYEGILLGLACASALPHRLTYSATRWPIAGTGALAVLAAVNLLFVFPENRADPRQYDAAVAREMPRVFDRMDWVDRHTRHERRTDLWRARAALDYGLPSLAAVSFERAVRPLDRRQPLLAPPTESERQAFLVRMRDLTPTMPPDRMVSAYERVLLALGERDAALFSLRLQLRGQSPSSLIHVPTADAPPFAAVVSMIAGDPLLAEDLRTWTADEIVTLLIRWGADAAFGSDTAADSRGLFILAAQRRWDTLSILVRSGDQISQIDEPLAPVTQREVTELAGLSVMAWSGSETVAGPGKTRYTLNVVGAGGVAPAAYVDLRDSGAAEFHWAEKRPVIAFTPAVRIRLSK